MSLSGPCSPLPLLMWQSETVRSLVLVLPAITEPDGGHRSKGCHKLKKESYRAWLVLSELIGLEGADRYRQAKWVVARAKTQVWEKFGEAMEEDYQLVLKKFWQFTMVIMVSTIITMVLKRFRL